MPQIPFAISERSIPGETGSPFMPSEDPVGAAIQRGGAQIEHSAHRFLAQQREAEERIQRAQQIVEAAGHENYLKELSAKKEEGLQGRTDYDNFETSFEQDKTEMQDYLETIQDPEVKMMVTRAAQGVLYEHGKLYRIKKAAVISDIGKAELDKSLGYDLQEWVQASSEAPISMDGEPTLSERDLVKARMTEKIAAAANAGIIKQTEAVNQIQRLDAVTEEVYARALINSDPGRALQEIPNLRNLDPIKQQSMISTAIGKIEQRDRQDEKAMKAAQEEAEQKVMDAIEAKDVQGATDLLSAYGAQRLLTPEKRRTLRTAIEMEAKAEAKSDPDAFYDLEQRVLLGKASIRDVLNASDVVIEDKNKLIKIFKDDKDPRKDYSYAEAIKSARNEIVTTGPLASLDPDQHERFTAYKRAAEKHAQAGGDPWTFYDNNVWKYRGAVPKTVYGTPTTVADIDAYQARLREDFKAGRIKGAQANLEAEKLKKGRELLSKRDERKKNAGK